MRAIFFPRNDFPVSVCAHRHGKIMTYVEQTDSLRNDSYIIINLAKKYNIKVGAFIGVHAHSMPDDELIDWISDGVLRCDYYFPPKSPSDPNIYYTKDEFEKLRSSNWRWFKRLNGRLPSTLSFGYGVRNYLNEIKSYILAARGSYSTSVAGKDYHYGYEGDTAIGGGVGGGIDYWMTRICTAMWWDDAKGGMGVESALSKLRIMMDECYAKGGMMHNFTHWHNVTDLGSSDLGVKSYDAYFNYITNLPYSNDIHFCSYGEAIEYMNLRESIYALSAYSPLGSDDIVIRYLADIEEKKHLLNTPISISIDLSMSNMDINNISCDGGSIVSTYGNTLILDIDPSMSGVAVLRKK